MAQAWATSDSKPLSEYIIFSMCVCAQPHSCSTLCYPWTIAHQAPLSMGFSRQEYRSGLPFHHLLFHTAKLLPDMLFPISFSFWWIPTHSSISSTTATPFWKPSLNSTDTTIVYFLCGSTIYIYTVKIIFVLCLFPLMVGLLSYLLLYSQPIIWFLPQSKYKIHIS